MAYDLGQLFNDFGLAKNTIQGPVNHSYDTTAIPPPKQNFFGNVAKSAVNVAKSAFQGGVVNPLYNEPTQLGEHLSNYAHAGGQFKNLDQSRQALTDQQTLITKSYQQGKISKDQYKASLKKLGSSYQQLSGEAKDVGAGLPGSAQLGLEAGKVGGTIVTLASGLGAAKAGVLGTDALAEGGNVVNRARVGVQGALKAGETLGKNPVTALAGKLVRNQAVTQPYVNTPGQVAADVKSKNYGGLALQAGLVAGVPLGLKYGGKLASAASDALYGSASGPIHAFFGDAATAASSKVQDVLKQAEAFTHDQPAVKNGADPAQFFRNYLTNTLKLPENTTPEEFAARFSQYAKAQGKVQDLQAAGKLDANLVASADYRKAIPEVTKAIDAAAKDPQFGDTQYRLQLARDTIAKLGINNPTIESKIGHAVLSGESPAEIKTALNEIVQKNVIEKGVNLPKGFILTPGPAEKAIVPKLGQAGDLLVGKPASRLLAPIGNALTKAGLSTKAIDQGAIHARLADNLDESLAQRGINAPAQDVLKALNSVEKPGVFDPRSLTKNEVRGALSGLAPQADPKQVMAAVREAYAAVPKQLVGAGPAAVDEVIKRFPGLAKYMRVQQALHFDLNPAFWLKQTVKGSAVAMSEGAQASKILFTDPGAELALKNADFFKAGKLGSDSDLNSLFGNEGSRFIRRDQQKILTGLADSVASSHGTTVDAILKENGPLAQEMKQALSITTSYGKGGYLNSPMAKTLNLLIFPSRFDTKIAIEAGKVLSKMNPVAQIAVVRSLGNAGQWLSSSEGQQWQKDNSELLGIIKYFTPVHTVDSVYKFLFKGHHVADLGELGGLPFGVISQILTHQGIDLGPLGSSQYNNPKTGEPVPDNIPITDKARVQQGFNDLISSLFSWPGRDIGIQGKNDLIKGVIPALKPDKGSTKAVLKNGQPAPSFASPKAGNLVLPKRGALPTVTTPAITPIYKNGARKARVKNKAVRPGVAF